MTLKTGDMVMVLRLPEPAHQSAGRPGAIGTVKHHCKCLQVFGLPFEAYKVEFSVGRDWCYPRKHLKKLDPPTDEDATPREREREAV
jgi:hypothetical protein